LANVGKRVPKSPFSDDAMKPYQKIPIRESGQPLVPIPADKFVIPSPHAYEKLGANYRGKSPYFLRQGVLNALIEAQNRLQVYQPGWQILIFDAYRPIEVQNLWSIILFRLS